MEKLCNVKSITVICDEKMKGEDKAMQVVRNATNVAYRGEHEFCKRVIRVVMGITPKERMLDKKEVDIVGVMCKLCIDGKDGLNLGNIKSEMDVCGVKRVGYQTLRNYMSSIRTKGWIVGKKLNPILMKAIVDGGFRVGIWLKRDGV